MGISGVIVVLNEQKVLRRALENLQRFTNEIVLVDSHSTDDTLKIAAEYNCRIFQRDFDNHRDQKNFAIEQCKSEWIFLLDADEYCNNKLVEFLLPQGDKQAPLLEWMNSLGYDALGLPRYNLEDGVGPRGWPDIQTRLFKYYCRHVGHSAHHQTTGNAKNPAVISDTGFGWIYHDKTLERQKQQNRMYYFMSPQDYKVLPEGVSPEFATRFSKGPQNPSNPDCYNEYLKVIKPNATDI